MVNTHNGKVENQILDFDNIYLTIKPILYLSITLEIGPIITSHKKDGGNKIHYSLRNKLCNIIMSLLIVVTSLFIIFTSPYIQRGSLLIFSTYLYLYQ